MKELIFKIHFYYSDFRNTVLEDTIHALASTPEEAQIVVKKLFQPRINRCHDGVYRQKNTLFIRVEDGQGLID